MKIALVYPVPADALDLFKPDIKRFAETFIANDPGLGFVFVPVISGYTDATAEAAFALINRTMGGMVARNGLAYSGHGCDIGSHQHAAHAIDADLMVCLSTRVFFHRANWLARIVQSWEGHGKEGIGAAMASFERQPHLRTCCYWTTPKEFRAYPHLINSRENTFQFESGEWNVSHWFQNCGKQVRMVTWDSSFAEPAWRTPPNIYRRGDQSNCLVFDRHTEIYSQASPEEKRKLEQYAGDK